MKFIIQLLITPLLISVCFIGTAQLTDDFSDGDFSANPTWTGDVSKYEINGANRLHTNGTPQSDTAYLATNVGNLDFSNTIVWEFFVQMDLNPSNSNNVRIYLVSDNANLKMPLNGYFIRIGENGSADALKFYKQVGTTATLLFTGTGNTFGSNPTASIKVTRTASGDWTFESDATGGTTYIAEGTVNNTAIVSSQFFGIWSKYTASNVTKFLYDNFVITANTIVDNTAPVFSNITIISNTQIDVTYNEPLEISTAQTTANYSVNNGIGNPTTAILDGSNPTLIHLTFATPFTDGQTNEITIENLEDLSNNVINIETHNFLYFLPVTASYKDLVINEIFADPSPQLGLPMGEYIEIYNASNHIFNLTNWTIGDASSDEQIGNYTLLPNQYLLIADDAYSFDYSIYSNAILVASLPSYNNSSDDVVLKDENGTIIDLVSYTSDWYGSPTKAAGGYTLELINPLLPCTSSSNWIGSNSPDGGTPAVQNSVYNVTPDVITPTIISASTANNATINLCFSETIDTVGITSSYFSIDNGISILSYTFNDLLECVEIITAQGLDTGKVYTVTINGISDCSGNAMNNATTTVILPHLGSKGDLIINEILYNPLPDGNDFIEIYNNSNKNIDLLNWQLAKVAGDTISSPKTITSNYLLKANEYVVITSDSNNIKENYSNATEGKFIQLSSLPSYADGEGTVLLLLPNEQVADSVHYDDSYQFALLKNTDGVSLERLDFNRPSNDQTNWHSAAEDVGFATPTLKNSQYIVAETNNAELTVTPEIFSPDNDGYDDVLVLSYKWNPVDLLVI